ncbi:MAG: phosphatidate cytidylyltransferase [Pseudomonadota bacterium]
MVSPETRTRLATAFILVGLVLLAAISAPFAAIMLVAIAGLAGFELAALIGPDKNCKLIAALLCGAGCLVFLGWFSPDYFRTWMMMVGLVMALVAMIAMIRKAGWSCGGVIIVCCGWVIVTSFCVLAHVFEARGLFNLFFVIAVVASCDSAAWLAGRSIGGPKLAVKISPNKTWAGFLGGLLAASAIAGLLGSLWLGERPFHAAIIGAWLAFCAQLGDLAISSLKRKAGVKDSGRLLPGHGGVLDRIDGYLLALPVSVLIALPGD